MRCERILSDRDVGAVKICASADQGSVKVSSDQQIQMYWRVEAAVRALSASSFESAPPPDIPAAYRHSAKPSAVQRPIEEGQESSGLPSAINLFALFDF
jgi:hypothetical protein